MITQVWPLFALTLEMPRLCLRLPREEEVAELAELAAAGVHEAHERPFLTPWTEGDPASRARFVVQQHWAELGGWSADHWRLGLGVFLGDRPIGSITLRAAQFPVLREVTTSSWLGLSHHGQGYGTEARRGALTLAFDHLGAQTALTEVFQDNDASQGVSRKLGYERDGTSRDVRGDQVVVSDRLRLTRSTWRASSGPRATVGGLAECRSLFAV